MRLDMLDLQFAVDIAFHFVVGEMTLLAERATSRHCGRIQAIWILRRFEDVVLLPGNYFTTLGQCIEGAVKRFSKTL